MIDTMTFSSFILSIGSLILSIVANTKQIKCSNCTEVDIRSNSKTDTDSYIVYPHKINISYDKSTQTNINYQDNFTQNVEFNGISIEII